MYRNISFSPNGEFILVSTIKKPFSYLVPYYRFPSDHTVFSLSGAEVKVLAEVPLIEELPKGRMAVRSGPRNFSWRSDKPASMCFVNALDNGDPQKDVEFRDELFQLDAPFKSEPISLLKTKNRFYRSNWCNDTLALASDYWWNNRNLKTYLFNPSDSNAESIVISDRNYQDRYNDPGSFVQERNEYGENILSLRGNKTYLIGDGYTCKRSVPIYR